MMECTLVAAWGRGETEQGAKGQKGNGETLWRGVMVAMVFAGVGTCCNLSNYIPYTRMQFMSVTPHSSF